MGFVGNPRGEVNRADIIKYQNLGKTKAQICKILKCSSTTINLRLKKSTAAWNEKEEAKKKNKK